MTRSTSEPGGGRHSRPVRPDGPAARAGLRPGDVIVAIGGAPVRTTEDLVGVELGLRAGESVDVTVERAGHRTTVAVVAERLPTPTPRR